MLSSTVCQCETMFISPRHLRCATWGRSPLSGSPFLALSSPSSTRVLLARSRVSRRLTPGDSRTSGTTRHLPPRARPSPSRGRPADPPLSCHPPSAECAGHRAGASARDVLSKVCIWSSDGHECFQDKWCFNLGTWPFSFPLFLALMAYISHPPSLI